MMAGFLWGSKGNVGKPKWKNVWAKTLGRMGFDRYDRSVFTVNERIQIINAYYAPVLQEIRHKRYLLTDRFR